MEIWLVKAGVPLKGRDADTTVIVETGAYGGPLEKVDQVEDIVWTQWRLPLCAWQGPVPSFWQLVLGWYRRESRGYRKL